MSTAKQNQGNLIIPALGRNVGLGYLYNERTDQFNTFTIFKEKIDLKDVVDLIPAPKPKIDSDLTNTYEKKFKLFNIDASIAANILSGQLRVEGSGHYLNDGNKSARDVTGIFKYEERTFVEYLNTHTDTCLKLYKTNVFDNVGATHIVSGIEWGGVVAVEFKDTVDMTEDKLAIDGRLMVEFEKLKGALSVSGDAKADIKSNDKSGKSSFKLSVTGDVSLPTQVPSTYQEVQELIYKVPGLIKKTNGGKGVPLKYHLMALPALRKHLKLESQKNDFVTKIKETILTSIVNLFDKISETEQNLNDVNDQLYNNEVCVADLDRNNISTLKKCFDKAKIDFSTELREMLVKVRSGENTESLLSKIINEYEEQENSPVKVLSKLNEFKDALKKVEMYQTIRRKYPQIRYFGRTGGLESALFESMEDCVYVLYMNSQFNEAKWNDWVTTRQIFFETLNQPSNRLFLVDCDFPWPTSAIFPKDLSNSVIHEYQKGKLTCDNVVSTVIEEEVTTQTRIEKLEDQLRKEIISGEQKWNKFFADYEVKPTSVYAPQEDKKAKLNDLHWIRDLILITKQSNTDLKDEAAKLSNWLLQLQEAENIFESNGSLKSLESQEKALSELMDEKQLYSFADVLDDKAKYTEALGLFEKIFKRRMVSLGSDHSDTISAQHKVAGCVGSLGEYSKALRLYRFAYHKWSQTLGPDNKSTLAAQHNVAWMLQSQGKYADALRIYEQVLQKKMSTLGENHASTKFTKSNVEIARQKLGKT